MLPEGATFWGRLTVLAALAVGAGAVYWTDSREERINAWGRRRLEGLLARVAPSRRRLAALLIRWGFAGLVGMVFWWVTGNFAVAILLYYNIFLEVTPDLLQRCATLLLFYAILPFFNGFWDWLSWGVSRMLGERIRHHRSWGSILIHGLLDFSVAAVFLIGLTVSLTAIIEGVNQFTQGRGWGAALELDQFLTAAAADPFGPDGAWITFMLITTLIPTAAHLLMLLLAAVATLGFPGWRRGLAARLAEEPSVLNRERLARYLTVQWFFAGMVLAALGGLLLWLIAEGAGPLSALLLKKAMATIAWVRGL